MTEERQAKAMKIATAREAAPAGNAVTNRGRQDPGGFARLLPLFPAALADCLEQSGAAPAFFCPEQLHLRRGKPAVLQQGGRCVLLPYICASADFDNILARLTGGALYSHEETLREGYLLYPGGYRVGVGGRASTVNGRVRSLRGTDFLIFRIPARHPGVASPLRDLFWRDCFDASRGRQGSHPKGAGMLLYAPPGEGKTTVLRDLAEQLSGPPWMLHTLVIDGREELFFGEASPEIPGEGCHLLDVLPGWPKAAAIETAIRCMSPQLLLCDEIGGKEEATALLEAGSGGVPLIATAHGNSPAELLARPSLRRLLEAGLFGCCIRLHRGADNRVGFSYTAVKELLSPEAAPGKEASS